MLNENIENNDFKFNPIDRTFGIEFEFADVKKSGVNLPDGFSWNKEEVVINTNGRNGTFSGAFGGEVNTPPLKICSNDIEHLKIAFDEIINNGGKITWTKSIHVHIYAGDFGLEELKKVFLLSYYTSSFIKEYGDVGDWNEKKWQSPSPTMEYVVGVKNAQTTEALFNVFANSMNKGYIRHLINIASFFIRKTIEFRFFNPTYNFEEVKSSILFAYRFTQYAVNHTEEDFKKITSMDDFKSVLKIRRPIAKKTAPLIFAGDQNDPHQCFVSKNIGVSVKMIKVLIEQSGHCLTTVNPNLYSLELSLYKNKELTIYNNSEFNHVIYLIAAKGLKIEYNEELSFIQDKNNDTPERQLSCLLFFQSVRKHLASNDFHANELDALKARTSESLDKISITASEICKMLQSVKYVHGTVIDAIDNSSSIFFQYDNDSKIREASSALKKHSNYTPDFEVKDCSYYNIVEDLKEDKQFMMVSFNDLLTMNKIAKVGGQIFYSTKDSVQKINTKIEKIKNIYVEIPPCNLVIDDYSKLRIVEVLPSEFKQVQRMFVKKVEKFSDSRFSFFVMYDKYCVGGFGFTYPKDTNYDLWLLSDFSTNNSIPRLAKLILLCIKSSFVKTVLSRRCRTAIESIYTKVYTTNSVSMKYRGVFDKVKIADDEKGLKYEAKLGVSGSIQSITNEYIKIVNRKQK